MPRHGTNERDYMSYPLEVSVGSKVASSAPPHSQKQTSVGEIIAELMEMLKNTDENGKLAKLNETTISDNNGGRIEL